MHTCICIRTIDTHLSYMSRVNQSKKTPHKKVQHFLVSAEAHSFETTTLEAVRPWRRKDDGHRVGQVLRDIALGRLVRGSSQQLGFFLNVFWDFFPRKLRTCLNLPWKKASPSVKCSVIFGSICCFSMILNAQYSVPWNTSTDSSVSKSNEGQSNHPNKLRFKHLNAIPQEKHAIMVNQGGRKYSVLTWIWKNFPLTGTL